MTDLNPEESVDLAYTDERGNRRIIKGILRRDVDAKMDFVMQAMRTRIADNILRVLVGVPNVTITRKV